MKFGAETWYYVEQPDPFGPDWLVRFYAQLVIRNPLIGLFGG